MFLITVFEKEMTGMRRFSGGILSTVLVALALGCASDIVLEDPPNIKGIYEGKYSVLDKSGGGGGVLREQNVIWTFEDLFYRMHADPVKPTGECFCFVFGSYDLDVGLRLLQDGSQPDDDEPACQTCQPEDDPVGVFTIIKNDPPLFIARKIDGDRTFEINLVKTTQ
ncbi:MAG: hypothetical protein ACE5FH_07475 [Candidatus Zixiibacteriota bacterium]